MLAAVGRAQQLLQTVGRAQQLLQTVGRAQQLLQTVPAAVALWCPPALAQHNLASRI